MAMIRFCAARRAGSAAAAGALISAIILLAVSAEGYFLRGVSPSAGQNDIIFKIFGELREVISAVLVVKADEYFHGGTKHPEHDAELCVGKDEHCLEEHGRAHAEHDAAHAAAGPILPRDLFARLQAVITERPVIHLSGEERKEIIPWFYWAARADPQNIQAYVLGAYWLSMHLQKTEEALRFLDEGIRRNPRAWQLYAQAGDIYFLLKKDYERAQSFFRRAYLLMDDGKSDAFELRRVLTFLAAGAERLDDKKEALEYYERLRDVSQDDTHLEQKIAQLKQELGEE